MEQYSEHLANLLLEGGPLLVVFYFVYKLASNHLVHLEGQFDRICDKLEAGFKEMTKELHSGFNRLTDK